MSKKKDNFFAEKRPWSVIKDDLLGCYFSPYLTKILYTQKPLLYVDCFAGKGRFDDGKPGSPLIISDIIKEKVDNSNNGAVTAPVRSVFIDAIYADDLKTNLAEYSEAEVISGKYEDEINGILENKYDWNVFLYIDPYGIKDLDCLKFDEFAKRQFYSVELLLNFNSFGFIREACRVFNTQLKIENGFFDDLIEYNPTFLDASENSIQVLNRIAGGEYWQKIIEKYKRNEINGYEMERLFANQFCCRLGQSYKYVLNMPIRIKEGQHPKYRMIHATNHPDGCVLMVDNIWKRLNELHLLQIGRQIAFFDTDVEDQFVNEGDIEKKVLDFYCRYTVEKSLNVTMAEFFTKYGVICNCRHIKDILEDLEDKGRVAIRREPPFTKKGTPSRFMSEKNSQQVFVRWVG